MTDLISLLLIVAASPGDMSHSECWHQSAWEHAPHVLRPPDVEGRAPRLPHQGVPGPPGHLTIGAI